MDRITTFDFDAPSSEDDEQCRDAAADRHANESEERRYSAEATLDTLDPYAAIIDGIPAPSSKP